jgi:TFIIH basal transcription factor complex TTD-A subunit
VQPATLADPSPVPPGVLIECDPSIKSIIVNIDSDNHEFIIEDLDEERVVVKENMVPLLKQKLEEVRVLLSLVSMHAPPRGLAHALLL